MSRQLEQKSEDRAGRRRDVVGKLLDRGLEAPLADAGAVLTGFSVRYGEYEVLVTVRAVLAGKQQIAFVASDSLPGALIKLVAAAKSDKLRWKLDRFASK